jgi:outer membrane biosynthesis protein TonB
MRSWRGCHRLLGLVSVFAAVMALGSFAPTAFAEQTFSSLVGTVDTVVQVPDPTDSPPKPPHPEKGKKPPKEKKPPKTTPSPTPTPAPTPTPTADPTPSPTLTPTPEPTINPSPEGAPTTTGNPPASTHLVGPGTTSVEASTVGGSAQNDPRVLRKDPANTQGGAGPWLQSVASILVELAATSDAPVRAAEGAPRCRRPDCRSIFGAIVSKAPALLLICLILGVGGSLMVRAGRRRSNTYPPIRRG